MIQNYISSDVILAKVMADLDIQEEGQRVTDMREWIFEAIEKIGASTQYSYKETGADGLPTLKITNYQASLPTDIYKIKMAAYSQGEKGPWQPMRSNTGSFKQSKDNNTSNSTNISYDPQYFLKPGYIVTNLKDGYIKIAYSAVVTDDRDYPMVPDLASYQEAVYWYVVLKLKYPEFLNGKLPENRYFYIKHRWNFCRNQAYAEAIMPNEADMISIKNNWLKLIPDVNAEQTFYATTGQLSNINRNPRGGVYL